jgi:hypothetical protein
MDIDPEKRTELLESAALAGDETIGGLTLRPMDYGTYMLWQRVCAFCMEKGPLDDAFVSAAFVYLHSKPDEYLAARFCRIESLAQEVVMFAMKKPAGYFRIFQEWQARQTDQFKASLIQGSSIVSDDPKV